MYTYLWLRELPEESMLSQVVLWKELNHLETIHNTLLRVLMLIVIFII